MVIVGEKNGAVTSQLSLFIPVAEAFWRIEMPCTMCGSMIPVSNRIIFVFHSNALSSGVQATKKSLNPVSSVILTQLDGLRVSTVNKAELTVARLNPINATTLPLFEGRAESTKRPATSEPSEASPA